MLINKARVSALIGKKGTTLEEQANIAAEAAIIDGEYKSRQRVEGIKRRAYYQAHLDHNPNFFVGDENFSASELRGIFDALPQPETDKEQNLYQLWYDLTKEKDNL